MSIYKCEMNFTNTSLINQNDRDSPLLQMPEEVLDRIGFWVATDFLVENDAVTNAVLWGRVCVRTHLSSHAGQVGYILEQVRMENDALQKIWNHISGQVVFQENPPSTLSEIKAWFNEPLYQGQRSSVKHLDLSNLQLEAIPPQILKFANLETLILDNNQISVIPDLMPLLDLEYLSLNNNNIRVIPDSLGFCSQLFHLSLNNNKISVIPATLVNTDRTENWEDEDSEDEDSLFCALEHLSLDNNQIKEIPPINDPELRHLSLNNNKIRKITGLETCRKLSHLSLNNNLIREVPRLLSHCAKLQVIQLYGNPIAVAPDFFGPRVNLGMFPVHNVLNPSHPICHEKD